MGERKDQTKTANDGELWGAVYKRLLAWSVKRHGLSHADAEETVQEAIRQFLKAAGDADPADLGGLLQALGSRINGLVVNMRRKKARSAVNLTTDGELAEPLSPEHPEQKIVRADTARKAIDALLVHVQGDELVFSIVMQMADGVEEPAALAKILARDIREVYNAKRRLATHVEAVKTMMEGW